MYASTLASHIHYSYKIVWEEKQTPGIDMKKNGGWWLKPVEISDSYVSLYIYDSGSSGSLYFQIETFTWPNTENEYANLGFSSCFQFMQFSIKIL